MILDLLTLENFGVYGGIQAVRLTPESAERPIILFGGLNGGGKTTLLDAIQLVLYGSKAIVRAFAKRFIAVSILKWELPLNSSSEE